MEPSNPTPALRGVLRASTGGLVQGGPSDTGVALLDTATSFRYSHYTLSPVRPHPVEPTGSIVRP